MHTYSHWNLVKVFSLDNRIEMTPHNVLPKGPSIVFIIITSVQTVRLGGGGYTQRTLFLNGKHDDRRTEVRIGSFFFIIVNSILQV